MRIITGDECGLIKESTVIPAQRSTTNTAPTTATATATAATRWIDEGQQQTRSRGVASLTLLPPPRPVDDDNDEILPKFEFASLRVDGSLETWEARRRQADDSEGKKKGEPLCYRRTGSSAGGNVFDSGAAASASAAKPVGLGCCCSNGNRPVLITCNSVGQVRVLSTLPPPSSSSSEKGLEVVARYDGVAGTDRTNTDGCKYVTNTAVTSFAVHGSNGMAAIGGRDRETVLMDVESGKIMWKAKNLPPDPQTLLQQPVWATATQFLTQNDDIGNNENSCLLAVGTGYKQLRIYDIRSNQRRPIAATPEGVLSHRVTSLCQLNATTLAVGDAAGSLLSVDTRKMGMGRRGVLGRYVGPGGSVRQVVKHPTKNVMGCVGLDRMLRTYDVGSRQCLGTAYLKQRLNAALFCEDEDEENGGETLTALRADGDDGLIAGEDDDASYLEEQDDVKDYSASSSDDDDEDVTMTAREEGYPQLASARTDGSGGEEEGAPDVDSGTSDDDDDTDDDSELDEDISSSTNSDEEEDNDIGELHRRGVGKGQPSRSRNAKKRRT